MKKSRTACRAAARSSSRSGCRRARSRARRCGRRQLGVAREPDAAEVPDLAVPLLVRHPVDRAQLDALAVASALPSSVVGAITSSRLRCEQSQGHRHRGIPRSNVDDLDDLPRERGRDVEIPPLADARRIPDIVDQQGPLPFSPSGGDYGNRPHRVKRRRSPGRPRTAVSAWVPGANRPIAAAEPGTCPSRCLAPIGHGRASRGIFHGLGANGGRWLWDLPGTKTTAAIASGDVDHADGRPRPSARAPHTSRPSGRPRSQYRA